MLVDKEGKPLTKSQLNYLPAYLGIVIIVSKKGVLETTEPKEPEFVLLLMITPQKLELYSQAEIILQEVILHNVLDSYVKRKYNKTLKDLDEKTAQKYLTELLNNYSISIQPHSLPLDYVVIENVDENELRKLVEAEKQKALFVAETNKEE